MAANRQLWSGAAADNDHAAAGNWDVAEAPENGDTLGFPAMAADSTKDLAGSDQHLILQVATFIEPGCHLEFGSRLAYLEIDTDEFIFAGEGQAYWSIDGCDPIRIENAAYPTSGHSYGFCLIGGATVANTELICDPGTDKAISIAALTGEAFACTTIGIRSGRVEMGSGITTTTLNLSGGAVNNRSATTTTSVEKAVLRQVALTAATLNIKKGGRVYCNGTAPTTVNLYGGGILDMSEVADALTIGTVNRYGGQIIDPHSRLTITTENKMVGGTSSFA